MTSNKRALRVLAVVVIAVAFAGAAWAVQNRQIARCESSSGRATSKAHNSCITQYRSWSEIAYTGIGMGAFAAAAFLSGAPRRASRLQESVARRTLARADPRITRKLPLLRAVVLTSFFLGVFGVYVLITGLFVAERERALLNMLLVADLVIFAASAGTLVFWAVRYGGKPGAGARAGEGQAAS